MNELFYKLPDHIVKRITFCSETKCWLVNGDPSSNGYQRVWYQGSRVMAHKLTYKLHYGITPRKRQIDHLCENRACCNPEHLDLVTASVNCKRKFNRRKKPK